MEYNPFNPKNIQFKEKDILRILNNHNVEYTIKNLELFPKVTITIYNRFGKLLQEINAINPSWNGTYQENELPSDDYWFNLNFGDGKIIKGHFSLKR